MKEKTSQRYKIKHIFHIIYLPSHMSSTDWWRMMCLVWGCCFFPLSFHIWLNKTFISFPPLLRELAAQPDVKPEIANPASFTHCCCDSSPIKTMRFHFSVRPSPSHNPLLPPLFPLLNQSRFVVSESTWLTVKHMMTQPGGNEHCLLLSACLTQMDCWDEDYTLWVKHTRKRANWCNL